MRLVAVVLSSPAPDSDAALPCEAQYTAQCVMGVLIYVVILVMGGHKEKFRGYYCLYCSYRNVMQRGLEIAQGHTAWR